jgi:hypothetical protein
MQAGLTKLSILVLVAVVVLAAGAVLVSGYVHRPDHAAQVLAEDRCDGCPLQGTDACGKVAETCEEQACPSPCAEKAEAEHKPAGCCSQAKDADSLMACPFLAGQCVCPGQE